ncbi:MAG: hypothetical protein ACMUIP_08560 [bacterium]
MRKIKQLFCCLFILGLVVVFFNSSVSAQFWQSMPPYNVLWPLWVTDPASLGITSIESTTILPVEPVWLWNVNLEYPWFFYNSPLGGLYFWDLWTGFQAVPDSGLVPPITLPAAYQFLAAPWAANDFATWANQANISYVAGTIGLTGATPFFDLLSPSILWGSPPWL